VRENEACFFVQLFCRRGPFEIAGNRITLLRQALDLLFQKTLELTRARRSVGIQHRRSCGAKLVRALRLEVLVFGWHGWRRAGRAYHHGAVRLAKPPRTVGFARCDDQEARLSGPSERQPGRPPAHFHGVDPRAFNVPPELGYRGAGARTARPFIHHAQPQRSRERDENQYLVAAVGSKRETQEPGLGLVNARDLRIPRAHSRPSDSA